jgi:hypothetical protein
VDSEALGAVTLDALWLGCQQRLVGHIAHDLKGALNGASVNIEVVRSRAERPDVKVADMAPYATAAGDQLAIVIRVTTALLNLTRPIRGPVEVAAIGKTLAGLMEESFRIAGARLDVTAEGGLSGATRASATAIRLLLGELFLLAAQQKKDLSVRLLATQPPTLELKSDAVLDLRPEVQRALTGGGIAVKTAGHGISIVLPSPT